MNNIAVAPVHLANRQIGELKLLTARLVEFFRDVLGLPDGFESQYVEKRAGVYGMTEEERQLIRQDKLEACRKGGRNGGRKGGRKAGPITLARQVALFDPKRSDADKAEAARKAGIGKIKNCALKALGDGKEVVILGCYLDCGGWTLGREDLPKTCEHCQGREHSKWKVLSKPLLEESKITLACELLKEKYTLLKVKEEFKEVLSLKEDADILDPEREKAEKAKTACRNQAIARSKNHTLNEFRGEKDIVLIGCNNAGCDSWLVTKNPYPNPFECKPCQRCGNHRQWNVKSTVLTTERQIIVAFDRLKERYSLDQVIRELNLKEVEEVCRDHSHNSGVATILKYALKALGEGSKIVILGCIKTDDCTYWTVGKLGSMKRCRDCKGREHPKWEDKLRARNEKGKVKSRALTKKGIEKACEYLKEKRSLHEVKEKLLSNADYYLEEEEEEE
jgi:hypothetical protein